MYKELNYYTDSLKTYLTSTYHISHPALVDLREDLLRRAGAIAQVPYLESTSRYEGSRRYSDLVLPVEISDLLTWLGEQYKSS